MLVDELLAMLIDRTGRSGRAVSVELGNAPTWAYNSTRPGRVPSVGTVADVADVAGCDVCIMDRETGAIVATVTPPRSVKGGADA